MNWGEFKKLVEAAGVRDGDTVDDLYGFDTDTDGCRCNLEDGGDPVTVCRVPEEHYLVTLSIAGREISFTWGDPMEIYEVSRFAPKQLGNIPVGTANPPGNFQKRRAHGQHVHVRGEADRVVREGARSRSGSHRGL